MSTSAPDAVAQLDEALRGSPYSLPTDGESRKRIATLVDQLAGMDTRYLSARQTLVEKTRYLLRRSHRVREIYESNRLEDLGPSLAGTHEILQSPAAHEVESVYKRHAMAKTFVADPKLHAVLGMHGAKLLAEDIMRSEATGRPLTETDLRSMHKLILGDNLCAGRYKRFVNSITGAEHEPFAPTDTPQAMSDLVAWLERSRRSRLAHPLIIAATAHAWLTHIHPFEDGNGRVARLLANIVIGNEPLPPLIVKSSSDRGKYIKALAFSDEAGDLALLVSVFARAASRAIGEMEDPKYALRLFRDELAARGQVEYERWTEAFNAWLIDLGAHLRLHSLSLSIIGSLSREDYYRFRHGRPAGATWVAQVESASDPKSLALLVLQNPLWLSEQVPRQPAIVFHRPMSVPWTSERFERVYSIRTDEVAVIPADRTKTYVREHDGVRMGFEDAPGYVAESLAAGFREGAFEEWNLSFGDTS